ncbi:MAG: hypothetical protein WCQ77_01840 [Planctomycetota bacterium]
MPRRNDPLLHVVVEHGIKPLEVADATRPADEILFLCDGRRRQHQAAYQSDSANHSDSIPPHACHRSSALLSRVVCGSIGTTGGQSFARESAEEAPPAGFASRRIVKVRLRSPSSADTR